MNTVLRITHDNTPLKYITVQEGFYKKTPNINLKGFIKYFFFNALHKIS